MPLLHFVMYTRSSCHLCAVAWALLLRARARHRFRLTAADVDADPLLREKYGDKVPVVAVNGKVRFWGRINAVLLNRFLEGERQRTESVRRRTTKG